MRIRVHYLKSAHKWHERFDKRENVDRNGGLAVPPLARCTTAGHLFTNDYPPESLKARSTCTAQALPSATRCTHSGQVLRCFSSSGSASGRLPRTYISISS